MKFYDVEPRSQEWYRLRLGLPTSSCFHRIVTPKTLQLSKQATPYMHQLLAEWITGEQIEGYQSDWMVRGAEIEDQIYKAYESYTGTETKRGGFFTTDDGLIGCSPDRLVGDDGDLETKAPAIQTQVGYALSAGPDEEYMLQLQGRLLIHERSWIDVFAWHPRLFIPPKRVYRDEKIIAGLRSGLAVFVDHMLKAREELESKFGPFVKPEPVDTFGVSDDDVEAIIQAAQ